MYTNLGFVEDVPDCPWNHPKICLIHCIQQNKIKNISLAYIDELNRLFGTVIENIVS